MAPDLTFPRTPEGGLLRGGSTLPAAGAGGSIGAELALFGDIGVAWSSTYRSERVFGRRSPHARAVHCITMELGGAVVHDQLTVRLPPDLNRALKAAARRMQRRSSEIVRLALREYLGATAGGRTRHADRVRELVGSLESGVPDLGDRHRDYVLGSLHRGR